MEKAHAPVNLVYWNIRGLGEQIVTLLEYCQIEYRYHRIDAPNEWFPFKHLLAAQGFEFPNLPYLEHHGAFLSESMAMMAYVATISGRTELLPATEPIELAKFLEILGVVNDLSSAFIAPCYTAHNDEEFRQAIFDSVHQHKFKLLRISSILSNNKWLMGDSLSLLDFRFAEIFERIIDMDQEKGLDNLGLDLTNFRRYVKEYLALERIDLYRKSNRFKPRPYNSSLAYWK